MTGTEVIGNNNNFVGWAAAALKWMKLLHRRGWLFANEAFVSERCCQRLVYIVDHHRPSTRRRIRLQPISKDSIKIPSKDRLQSHHVHLTMSQSYACIQHTVIHNRKLNLSTVKWAQWDKTQARELLCLFICLCIALCTIVAHNIA